MLTLEDYQSIIYICVWSVSIYMPTFISVAVIYIFVSSVFIFIYISIYHLYLCFICIPIYLSIL